MAHTGESRRSRPGRRLGAAISLLVVAAVASVASPVSAAAGRAPAAAPVTPLLSVRRVPDWVESSAADRALAAGLPTVLRALGPARRSSCLVVERTGTTVAAVHPDRSVLPASNLKLLLARAVLDRFGPDARITTTVQATVSPVGGVVHGNLFLVGAGDPVLRTAGYQAAEAAEAPVGTSLSALAAAVKAAGVRVVTGSVVGDDSLFDTARSVPTWKPTYTAEGDVGPISALEVDDGFGAAPPHEADTDPPLAAARDLTRALRAAGVRVVGSPGAHRARAGTHVVASVASPTIGRIVGQVLRVSDDTGAEVLTKLLGARFGAGGTTTDGVAVIRADLVAHGIGVRALHQLDGSGLDTGDRVTCSLVASVLARSGTHGALFAGLPVAGRTGTLQDRMTGTVAAGRVHAKTGTLDGVSALSGFVLPAAGHGGAPIVFAFIANGVSEDTGVDVGDALGEYLASPHPYAPLADALPRTAP